MRLITVVLAALIVTAAGTASAQVAAPLMNPVVTPFGTPTNPSVLSWDVPSRISLSYSPAKLSVPNAPADPVAKGTVRSAVATWVGQTFAIGAARSLTRLNGDPSTPGSLNADSTVAAASVRFGERLAVGVGYEASKQINTIVGSPEQEEKAPAAGVSWRVTDTFFLSAAGGRGTFSEQGNGSADRSFRRAGVGIYSRGKGGGVHIEAYRAEKTGVELPAGSGTSAADKEETTGGTLEVLWGPLLIACYGRKTDNTNLDPTQNNTAQESAAALGYVPEQGWSIVISAGSNETDNTTGNEIFTFKTSSIGVAYLF